MKHKLEQKVKEYSDLFFLQEREKLNMPLRQHNIRSWFSDYISAGHLWVALLKSPSDVFDLRLLDISA